MKIKRAHTLKQDTPNDKVIEEFSEDNDSGFASETPLNHKAILKDKKNDTVVAAVDSFGNAIDSENEKKKKFNGIKHKNKMRKEKSPTIIAGDSISNGNMAANSS